VDARGAALLAARIKAGVRVGNRIEVLHVGDTASRLSVGDCGIVRAIFDDGRVLVFWDRGLTERIDPDVCRYKLVG
jgi:hypothetical protein